MNTYVGTSIKKVIYNAVEKTFSVFCIENSNRSPTTVEVEFMENDNDIAADQKYLDTLEIPTIFGHVQSFHVVTRSSV